MFSSKVPSSLKSTFFSEFLAQDLRLKPIKLSSKSSKTIKHGSIPDPIQLDPRRKGLTNYRMFRSSTSRSDPIRAAIYVFVRDKEEKSRKKNTSGLLF